MIGISNLAKLIREKSVVFTVDFSLCLIVSKWKLTREINWRNFKERIEMKIYRNYGVLGAEKRIVYTCDAPHCSAIVTDEIEVELPKGWKASKNIAGQTLVKNSRGLVFLMDEILGGSEYPCFFWYEGMQHCVNRLKIK